MATAELTIIGLGGDEAGGASRCLAEVRRRLAAQDRVRWELTVLKLDDRRDRPQTLADKVAAVERAAR
jgi:uncharacterized protein YqgV (UPF0045/DUF77 family)